MGSAYISAEAMPSAAFAMVIYLPVTLGLGVAKLLSLGRIAREPQSAESATSG